MVRNLRDPQEDLNKRRSKALFILSTNGIIADKDAFEDWDEVIEELPRPDKVLKKKAGFEVKLLNETALAEEHIMLMREDKDFIQSASGVTDELLGRQTNAVSGAAIQARQNQGSVVTAEIFDNLRHAIQLQGEIQLSLIEQFYDMAKTIRITEAKGPVEFLGINQPRITSDGQVVIENDITETQADFVVDTQDFRESVRVAMFESLMNLCSQLPPDISLNLLDMVVDLVDIPGKNELVKRIRKLNGQTDPEQVNDPEAVAEQEAREQAEAEQAEIERQALINELREQEAKVRKLLADAQLVLEKAETERLNREVTVIKTRMERERMDEEQKANMHERNFNTFTTLNDARSAKDKHRSMEGE
ncbi:MAG: hypothetical protein A4E61_00167 [Syntrophorhabdus sp. PtaB.Bin184]|nr:MAG: hypothetical protein A4E61_00167 [Syntrophorhabdus sp. PtaB.Bin184]